MDETKEVHFLGKVAQKALIQNENGEVLLTTDPRSPGFWELPGGRLNEGEDPKTGLARELKEELGVDFIIHEPMHLEQFWQGSDNQNALMIIYRASLNDPQIEFKVAVDEVDEVAWVNLAKLGEYKLFPQYERFLKELNSKQI